MPHFSILAKEGPPRTVPIYKRLVGIGRAPSNDVVLDSETVSEFHAQLLFDGKDFTLTEGPEGGFLRFNGKRKKRSKVFHQDRITVGDIDLVFNVLDEPSAHPLDALSQPQSARREELMGMMKLSEFNSRLMRTESIKEQLEALLDAVIEVFHADKGFVILLEGEDVRVAVARQIAQKDIPQELRHLSDSILKKVIETKQPLVVSDALHDDAFSHSESIMNLKLSSVMCAPLINRGKLLGIIYLGNDHVVRLFDQRSLDVFRIFSGQASLILENSVLLDQLLAHRDQLVDQLEHKRFGDIIGTSPVLQEVFRNVNKVANTDIGVLITGETGTGKELIAREIHRRSNRKEGPFVVINCGAIPENLIESELFGHVRGAFTGAIATRPGKFQLANGGTLFLDEIGELSPPLQVKLLRVLQEKVVTKVGGNRPESLDIRVLSATHRNLQEQIRTGQFREDLFYRLNVVNLHLPPLRERGDDLILITKYLLNKFNQEFGTRIQGLTEEALVALRKYSWPGNVRQLENRLKKAVVLCDSHLLRPEDLDLAKESDEELMPLAEAREVFQRKYVLSALERNNGNRTKAAHDLGVDPRTIFRYLERESQLTDPGTFRGESIANKEGLE